MKMNILCAALIASSAAFAGLATTTTSAIAGQWKNCTHEGGFCKVGAGTSVRYGTSPHKSGSYNQKKAGNGGIWCDNHNFGDPALGKRKNCWVLK